MTERYKAGDSLIYSQLVNRKLIDRDAVFIRYITVGREQRERCVIHVKGTISPRMVATTSITAR